MHDWSTRQLESRHRLELELHTMPYDEYLETDHWRHTRNAALAAASYACQVCNDSRGLDVHHRTYERRGCESLADLTVLCGACHELFHKHGRVQRRLAVVS